MKVGIREQYRKNKEWEAIHYQTEYRSTIRRKEGDFLYIKYINM